MDQSIHVPKHKTKVCFYGLRYDVRYVSKYVNLPTLYQYTTVLIVI
eukprot:SAG31_NODE_48120_length_199_cov_14.360000_1_plen_45_part_01